LTEDHHVSAATLAQDRAPKPAAAAAATTAEAPILIRRTIRPRRPRPPGANQAVQLWLVFGTVAAVALIWSAFQSARQRMLPQVQGANEQQQKIANALFAALAADSNAGDAHHHLADVLYDTGNWSDAIVHYRAVLRRDSTRVPAIVDLGVCYFNLGDSHEAERLFLLALTHESMQTVALFNLGILNESRGDNEQALQFYDRAIASKPPAALGDALEERRKALAQKMGRPVAR